MAEDYISDIVPSRLSWNSAAKWLLENKCDSKPSNTAITELEVKLKNLNSGATKPDEAKTWSVNELVARSWNLNYSLEIIKIPPFTLCQTECTVKSAPSKPVVTVVVMLPFPISILPLSPPATTAPVATTPLPRPAASQARPAASGIRGRESRRSEETPPLPPRPAAASTGGPCDGIKNNTARKKCEADQL